jgi:hypothetical protein
MSGHSTFSAAAAALEGFFGTDSMSFCISADPNAASLPNALGGTGFIDPADATGASTSLPTRLTPRG